MKHFDQWGNEVNPADVLDAYEAGTHPCRGGCGLEVLGIHGHCADCAMPTGELIDALDAAYEQLRRQQ